LSRLPVKRVETVELGRLHRDPASLRSAVLAEIEVGDASITVAGTHLAHFTHGSPILLERLRRQLPVAGPALLAGDMNFWGPPLSLGLPGWRRAVRARTYPSWRAHSQIDHIFVTRAVEVIAGASVAVGRSDHLPLWARIALE
jgi:endonuclease/exonuclease/phosphatase family metal-dependent hydrolase